MAGKLTWGRFPIIVLLFSTAAVRGSAEAEFELATIERAHIDSLFACGTRDEIPFEVTPDSPLSYPTPCTTIEFAIEEGELTITPNPPTADAATIGFSILAQLPQSSAPSMPFIVRSVRSPIRLRNNPSVGISGELSGSWAMLPTLSPSGAPHGGKQIFFNGAISGDRLALFGTYSEEAGLIIGTPSTEAFTLSMNLAESDAVSVLGLAASEPGGFPADELDALVADVASLRERVEQIEDSDLAQSEDLAEVRSELDDVSDRVTAIEEIPLIKKKLMPPGCKQGGSAAGLAFVLPLLFAAPRWRSRWPG